MIKHLHLYDILTEVRQPISVNFNFVRYFVPNTVDSSKTDIYFSEKDKITVWENYDSLLQ